MCSILHLNIKRMHPRIMSTDSILATEIPAGGNEISCKSLLANPIDTLDVHDANQQSTYVPRPYWHRVVSDLYQSLVTPHPKLVCQSQLGSLADDTTLVSPQSGIAAAVRGILYRIGEDPDREGLLNTPDRYAKALLFFTKGYSAVIEEVVNNAIFSVDTHDLIILRDIDIFSMCEHHMVPFIGKVGLPPAHPHPQAPSSLVFDTRSQANMI